MASKSALALRQHFAQRKIHLKLYLKTKQTKKINKKSFTFEILLNKEEGLFGEMLGKALTQFTTSVNNRVFLIFYINSKRTKQQKFQILPAFTELLQICICS